MWEGTDLFESTDDFPYPAGDYPGTGGDLPGSQGSVDDWFSSLGKLGGKAIDAYKSYIGLEQEKANVDAARTSSQIANERARQQAQLERDLLGFEGQAERARAAQAARAAAASSSGSASGGLSIGLVTLLGLAFVLVRQ